MCNLKSVLRLTDDQLENPRFGRVLESTDWAAHHIVRIIDIARVGGCWHATGPKVWRKKIVPKVIRESIHERNEWVTGVTLFPAHVTGGGGGLEARA
jgi:hypothetical protein